MNERPPRSICFWPGLAGLWLYGHWASLFVAVGFSLILNLALLSTFVWPGWFSTELKWLIWPTVLITWMAGAWLGWRTVSGESKNGLGLRDQDDLSNDQTPENAGKSDDTLLIQAQTEYLRGDYSQAEMLLTRRLHDESRDTEARLLLATIYCRTRRYEKASHQLKNLSRLDSAIAWGFEIRRLRKQIDQQVGTQLNETETINDSENPADILQDEDSPERASKTEGTVKLGQSVVALDGGTVHEDKQLDTSQPDPEIRRAA